MAIPFVTSNQAKIIAKSTVKEIVKESGGVSESVYTIESQFSDIVEHKDNIFTEDRISYILENAPDVIKIIYKNSEANIEATTVLKKTKTHISQGNLDSIQYNLGEMRFIFDSSGQLNIDYVIDNIYNELEQMWETVEGKSADIPGIGLYYDNGIDNGISEILYEGTQFTESLMSEDSSYKELLIEKLDNLFESAPGVMFVCINLNIQGIGEDDEQDMCTVECSEQNVFREVLERKISFHSDKFGEVSIIYYPEHFAYRFDFTYFLGNANSEMRRITVNSSTGEVLADDFLVPDWIKANPIASNSDNDSWYGTDDWYDYGIEDTYHNRMNNLINTTTDVFVVDTDIRDTVKGYLSVKENAEVDGFDIKISALNGDYTFTVYNNGGRL